mgnify:CR=1 FL=1
MAELFKVTELYNANLSAAERTCVNQGGTSSGKTYAIMQVLYYLALTNPRSVTTVVGQDVPNLKKGAYRDATTIRDGSSTLMALFPYLNEGERIIRCINGSVIEFSSFKDAQDAKSGKRDFLFINEANGITYEVYWQLAIRTRKRVFIDYNPTARFWVHDKVLGRDGVRLIISDHRKNYFLTEEEHARIEGIEDKELWKVYARGLTGMITGLVLTNYDIVDALPPREEWKMSARGMDFGFTCFKGDTLIMTSEGEKPIKDVKAGDYVLTRKGYRRVVRNIYNGYKKVIHKKFDFDLHSTDIFCTFEHNFNANGKWKKYGKLTKEDNLFVLSSSMVSNIADTQTVSTQIISTTSGKKMGRTKQRCCITQSLKKLTALQYPMVWLSITRISIRLTMISAILLCSLLRNICAYITICQNGLQTILRNTTKKCTRKRIGTNAEKRCLQTSQQSVECANGAEQNIHPQTPISVSVENNAIINGNTKHPKTMCRWFASGAEKLSRVINTLNQNVAAMSVPITYQQPTELTEIGFEYCDVYDLWIDGVHEYFANGILVHNCDPTALEHVVLAHGDLWIDEEIYNTGLTNPDIAERAKAQGVTSGDVIIADCAEPKSIRELQAAGLWVVPSPKGADSIVSGIDILKRYRLHITRRSRGLISNIQSYKWAEDKDGNLTNKPEDKNNHGIDAVRYVGLARLAVRREVRGVRRRN